jgi:hypothetical protein
VYLLPSIIGRRRRNAGAIIRLNLFLGWTVVGWFVAMFRAIKTDDDRKKVTPLPLTSSPEHLLVLSVFIRVHLWPVHLSRSQPNPLFSPNILNHLPPTPAKPPEWPCYLATRGTFPNRQAAVARACLFYFQKGPPMATDRVLHRTRTALIHAQEHRHHSKSKLASFPQKPLDPVSVDTPAHKIGFVPSQSVFSLNRRSLLREAQVPPTAPAPDPRPLTPGAKRPLASFPHNPSSPRTAVLFSAKPKSPRPPRPPTPDP